jgi:hypothetical protein
VLAEHFGEFVHEDEQGGQRRQAGTLGPCPLVVGDVRESPCCPEHLLAPVHLAGERIVHPADEVRFTGEIGDDGADVPGALQPEKRRATFEVDQDEVQSIRRMGRDHPECQRTQQFGFAGPGGTHA